MSYLELSNTSVEAASPSRLAFSQESSEIYMAEATKVQHKVEEPRQQGTEHRSFSDYLHDFVPETDRQQAFKQLLDGSLKHPASRTENGKQMDALLNQLDQEARDARQANQALMATEGGKRFWDGRTAIFRKAFDAINESIPGGDYRGVMEKMNEYINSSEQPSPELEKELGQHPKVLAAAKEARAFALDPANQPYFQAESKAVSTFNDCYVMRDVYGRYLAESGQSGKAMVLIHQMQSLPEYLNGGK